MKRFVCLFLSLLLCFCSCGKDENSNIDYGDISQSENIDQPIQNDDNIVLEQHAVHTEKNQDETYLIAEYLYNFTKHFFAKYNMFPYFYSGFTLVDNTENWYMIKCVANEFTQPNATRASRMYEVYSCFYVTECEISSGKIVNIKYDKTLGSEGLIQTHRNLAVEGPGNDAFIRDIKATISWGKMRSAPISVEKAVETAPVEKMYDFDSTKDASQDHSINSVSNFEAAPFNPINFEELVKRNDWYDNGIFSSYVDAVFQNKSWEYLGLMNGEIDPNPYSYNGYDVYCIEKQHYFVVPYSEYVAAPIVYEYDSGNNSIRMVFNNGEIK